MPSSTTVEYVISLRDKVSKSLNNINKNIDKTESNVTSLGSTLARIGGALAIGAVAKSVVSLGVEMEQTRVSFATFLGDAEKGNKLIGELEQFANVTPFDNAAVIQAGKVLLTTGMAAENVSDRLKVVGDIAAGANVPLTEMASIYAKAMNKGKLQAEELNQLSERGVPIIQVLAKKFGVLEEEVFKMGSEGKITAKVMNEAFDSMTSEGGTFFNLMEKQSKTVGGRFSTLVGKLQTLGIRMGETMLPVLGALTSVAIMMVDNIEALKTMGIVVGIAAVAWAALNIPLAISIIKIKLLTAAQWLLNAALNANPIGIVIGLLAALAAAIVIAWRHSETFRGVILGLWEAAKVVFGNLKKTFMEIPKFIIEAFKEVPMAFMNLFTGIGDILTAIFTGEFDKLPSLLKEAGKNLVKTNPLAGTAVKIGKSLGEGTGDAFNKAFDAEVGAEGDAATGVSGVPGAAIGAVPSVAGAESDASDVAGKGTTVKSAAPKVFNINIGSLIEENNINTTTLTEGVTEVQDRLVEALLGATNDVQTSVT